MAEMKTLNGYEVVDAKAREDIKNLSDTTDQRLADIELAIPSLEGYATEAYVNEAEQAAKDYADEQIAEIPGVDLTGYATEAYVNDAIESTPKAVYLDFSTLTAEAQAATTEETALFEQIASGERPLVYIRSHSRTEYFPAGYTLRGNRAISFISSRVSHIGYGYYSGDNQLSIDGAWYKANKAADGTWTVYQSSGCTNVQIVNSEDLAAAVNNLEQAIEAIPEPDLSPYALKSELPEVPTNVSAFTNDAGYLTEHQSLEGYALKTDIPDVSSYQTEDQVNTLIQTALSGIATAEGGSY